MSVTVVTTLGNTWEVKDGKSWAPVITPVGVEGVSVYDSTLPDGTPGKELAMFGPVEMVCVDGAAAAVPPRGL